MSRLTEALRTGAVTLDALKADAPGVEELRKEGQRQGLLHLEATELGGVMMRRRIRRRATKRADGRIFLESARESIEEAADLLDSAEADLSRVLGAGALKSRVSRVVNECVAICRSLDTMADKGGPY